MTDVLSRLPALTVTWKLRSPTKQDKPVKQDSETQVVGGGARGQRWVNVGVTEECVVVVEITRNSKPKVYT